MDKKPATKKCATCGALPTRGTYDMREVPRPPGEWKEFVQVGGEKLGCDAHPPVSYTTYLDGRVIRTEQAIPEKV